MPSALKRPQRFVEYQGLCVYSQNNHREVQNSSSPVLRIWSPWERLLYGLHSELSLQTLSWLVKAVFKAVVQIAKANDTFVKLWAGFR